MTSKHTHVDTRFLCNPAAPTEPRAAVAYWQHLADTAITATMREQAQHAVEYWQTLVKPPQTTMMEKRPGVWVRREEE